MAEFSKDDILSFMELALKEAHVAEALGEVPVGAVLVSLDGQILSKGHNRPISTSDPTAHAEIIALRDAATLRGNYRLTDTVMFVTLEPCIMCAGAMVWARVKKVYFGAWDKKAGAFGSVININDVPGLNHRIESEGGILEGECAQILKEFFRKRRSKS